jgi:hypothetical protein
MKRRLHFYSSSEIQAHLNKQRTSGLSVDRYCNQEKVAVSTFWNWRKRNAITAHPSATPPPFARVGVMPFIPMQGFEVVFDNKVTVRVPSRFETESLRSLFDALK